MLFPVRILHRACLTHSPPRYTTGHMAYFIPQVRSPGSKRGCRRATDKISKQHFFLLYTFYHSAPCLPASQPPCVRPALRPEPTGSPSTPEELQRWWLQAVFVTSPRTTRGGSQLPSLSRASRQSTLAIAVFSTPCLVTTQLCQLAPLPRPTPSSPWPESEATVQGHPSQIDALKLAQKGTLVKLRAAPLAVPPTGKGLDAQPRPKISSRNARHGESLSEGGMIFHKHTSHGVPRGHSSDHRPPFPPLSPHSLGNLTPLGCHVIKCCLPLPSMFQTVQ